MDMNNNDLIFSGTKDVAENLKFDEARLQEWFGDHVPVLPLTEEKILALAAMFKRGGSRSWPNYVTVMKDKHIELEAPGT